MTTESNQDVAIEIRDLRKTFSIHSFQTNTLKELLLKGIAVRPKKTTFVALDGVTVEVKRGKALAIVGANGSGKSTLLKIISGISKADSGTVALRGRVAALLELGAGFHPDLTGMENIFLQGGILGYSRDEILSRLDVIIDFSELRDFIHTPLKRYSSGMRIRLGFSLACFSDAEILLIDEVLSVGDAAFQEKCLRKLGELREQGRTIIFVSHHIDQVQWIADEIMWLEKGSVRTLGEAEGVIAELSRVLARYENTPVEVDDLEGSVRSHYAYVASSAGTRMRARGVRIDGVRFLDDARREVFSFPQGSPAVFEVNYTVLDASEDLMIEVGLGGYATLSAAYNSTKLSGVRVPAIPGSHIASLVMDRMPFAPGRFRASVAIREAGGEQRCLDAHVEMYPFVVPGRRPLSDPGPTVESQGRFPGDEG